MSRFCLDPGLSRDNSPNSGSFGTLRDHSHHITNVGDDGSIPAVPSPNYKEYNNFRSGDLSPPDGKKTPDAALKVPEACVLECSQGSLILWVHVGNEGASPLTAPGTLTVTGIVDGQEAQLGIVDLVDVVDIGQYTDAFEFQIDPTGLESVKIVVSPKEQECDLANNEVVLQGPFCG